MLCAERNDAKTHLVNSGFNTLATNAVQIVCQVGLSAILARTLGPSGKGAYELCIMTSALGISLAGFSIPSGVAYVVARQPVDTEALDRRLTLMAVLQATTLFAILFGLNSTHWGAALMPRDLGFWAPLVIALMFLCDTMRGNWRAVLAGQLAFGWANISDLWKQVLSLSAMCLIAAAVLLLRLTTTTVLGLSLAAYIVSSLVSGMLVRLHMEQRCKGSSTNMSAVLRYALPCFAANLVQSVNYRFCSYAVGGICGLASLGIFQTAFVFSQGLTLLPSAAATLLTPAVASGENSGRRFDAVATCTLARLVFYFSTVAAAGLALIVPIAVPLLLGEQFRAVSTPLLCLLPGCAIFSITTVLAAHLGGLGKPSLNLLSSTVGMVVMVPASLVLLKMYGIAGGACAVGAGFVATTVCTMVLFSRSGGVSLKALLVPTDKDVAAALAIWRRFQVWPERLQRSFGGCR